MLERPVDLLFDTLVDRSGHRELIKRLDLNRGRCGCSNSSGQVAAGNLFRSQDGLKSIVGLRCGAARLENVRQCRQSVRQTFFGSLLHGLGVGQTRSRRILLPHCVQEPVVGFLYPVDYVSVCVVKCEIGRQKVRSRGVDASRSRPEVENRVVEIQLGLKILKSLANKLIPKQDLHTSGLGQHEGGQCWIELTAGDAQRCGTGTSMLPGDTRFRIMLFSQVDKFRQRIRLLGIDVESNIPEMSCIRLNCLFCGRVP